jgi:hypothetical protein
VAESPVKYQAKHQAISPSLQGILNDLLNLDVDSMTPVEAIMKLYELKRKSEA